MAPLAETIAQRAENVTVIAYAINGLNVTSCGQRPDKFEQQAFRKQTIAGAGGEFDDFVRHIGTIETRIDNFALRMERVLEQLLKGGTK